MFFRLCCEEPAGLPPAAGLPAALPGLPAMLPASKNHSDNLGEGSCQFLPLGVDRPVHGPGGCLCVVKTSACAETLLFTSRDGKASVIHFTVFWIWFYLRSLVYILCVFFKVVYKMTYIPHETLHALLGSLKKIWTGTLAGGAAGLEFGVVALKSFNRWAVLTGEIISYHLSYETLF